MESEKTNLSDIAYLPVDIPSHVIPFLSFLSELEAKGLNFDIYGSKSIIEDPLDKLGQNHFEFEELGWNKVEGRTGLFRSTYNSFLKTVSAVEAIWEENKKKPNLIIADVFTVYAKYLAKKHGIPLLVLHSSFFLGNFSTSFKEEKDKTIQPTRDESLIPLEKEVEEKYGVSIKSMKEVYTYTYGDQNISWLPKIIGDRATDIKDGYSYIGPALRDETKAEIPDIDPAFLKDKDLIYVSFGTAGPNKAFFSNYDTIVEVLKDTPHKVLISATMGKAEELIAKGLPKNIIVKSWVPQIKVLEHSKLFISHAGAGGVMEALATGVPIIAVPNFADQPVFAAVAEELGVGRWLKDKSPEGFRKIVEEVLSNEEIKVGSQKYKELFDSQASKAKFVEIVRSLLK